MVATFSTAAGKRKRLYINGEAALPLLFRPNHIQITEYKLRRLWGSQ